MIEFEEGILEKGAYVIIDGVEYPVVMPKYSGNTPISPEALNKIQQDLQQYADNLLEDSGWIQLETETMGLTPYNDEQIPQIRKIGKQVFLRGAFKGVTELGTILCTIPEEYRPTQPHAFSSPGSGTRVNRLILNTSGELKFEQCSVLNETFKAENWYPINTTYLVD